ncbi:type II toxin-antitoxin system RelE/ParE family toxin [Candidatus Saccharibacteria bacterium]|nr:type II toxin-antitoxin system RelE/ParE family toxin [Candidatus Saccharibacteria bacterium]
MEYYQVVITAWAERSILDIGTYIQDELGNYFAAKSTIKGIRLLISSLHFAPARSHIRDNFYKVHYKKYKIIYCIENKTVIVLDVIYSGRNYFI